MSGSDSMGSAGGQTKSTLLQEEVDRKAALKKLDVGRTGGPKIARPPTMPQMMPADYKDPADDNVQTPNFSEEDDDFERVEAQTGFDMAKDTQTGVDIEKSGSEEEDEAMEGVDDPMEGEQTSEGTPASVSSSANERTEKQLMGVLGSAAFAARHTGKEDKRMADADGLRDTSVNRTPGVTLITITLKEKNYMRMGQMVGTLHRMEGVKLRAQLFNPEDPTELDLILDIDNVFMGKLLGMALTADMAQAIKPKLTGSARTRSTEATKTNKLKVEKVVEPLNVEGTSGGGGSSRDDKKTHKLPRLDVITKLIVDGDEEELLEVMRRMGTQQLRERTVDFLEKNNTGIDDAHSLKDKLVKLKNFQAAGVFMRMYEQKSLDKKKTSNSGRRL
jgi:hypothetical protein